jgi:hypothetical protein
VKLIKDKELETRKQEATYVGLTRTRNTVHTSARVSTPLKVKEQETRQIISLINAEFLHIHGHGDYFGVPEADELIDPHEHQFIFAWPHDSGLKSRRYLRLHVSHRNA